ncbi:hypothetical protein H0H81_011678 [Sphagnurus paluster]|uniref:FAD-binding domain-containing protein n=1 Tax=Sphagnurus paluster TaxID=117069 RepID=A0A9P7G163_9AGAR|nr:hypothetical protein H0H81_011678 [Sphagnurus paluster]
MPSCSKFRVVICGAGIGGLTAAVALSEYPDIDVEVYECAAELAEVGAGICVYPRPWEILRRLGVTDDLLKYTEAREGAAPSFKYRKSDQNIGVEFCKLATCANSFTFHRADFQQSLLRRLPASCRTHCSKRLRSYFQRPTGVIDVLFEDGSTTVCDILVGADGIKSAVRGDFVKEQVAWARSRGRHIEVAEYNAAVDPVWSGTVAYRALIPAERLRSRAPNHPIFLTPTQHYYVGKNNFVIAYPVSRGKLINFAAFSSRPELENTIFDGPWVSTVDKEEFSSLFSAWEPDVQDLISV